MIEEKEILRRRDMRETFTFTIDPADAKDFDDALSFEIINQGEASNKDEVSNRRKGFSWFFSENSICEKTTFNVLRASFCRS